MPRRQTVPVAATPTTRGVEGQRIADLGNGLRRNPVLSDDRPDLNVLKDGAEYDAASSPFTLLIGQSADAWGYDPLFVSLAGLDLVAAAVLWSLLRAEARTARS